MFLFLSHFQLTCGRKKNITGFFHKGSIYDIEFFQLLYHLEANHHIIRYHPLSTGLGSLSPPVLVLQPADRSERKDKRIAAITLQTQMIWLEGCAIDSISNDRRVIRHAMLLYLFTGGRVLV
jgi:hypothetical protein